MFYEKYPEPFIVQKTDRPEHVTDTQSVREWFEARLNEAIERGGVYPRFTISEDKTALLFECWNSKPIFDQDFGEPRWQLAVAVPRVHDKEQARRG